MEQIYACLMVSKEIALFSRPLTVATLTTGGVNITFLTIKIRPMKITIANRAMMIVPLVPEKMDCDVVSLSSCPGSCVKDGGNVCGLSII